MLFSDFIENLTVFGLTRQEATLYQSLLSNGEMTGYEVAKITGISRSNVYASLNGLVEKGAAYVEEGESAKYTPVPIKEFTANILKTMEQKADFLEKNAPAPLPPSDGYITIKGAQHINNKISQLLEQTQIRLYVFAEKELLESYRSQLQSLVQKDIKVVILSDGFVLEGAKVYNTEPEKGQLRLISDTSYVLTGELTGSTSDTCLFSGQQNLVSVMREALKNKIILLEK